MESEILYSSTFYIWPSCTFAGPILCFYLPSDFLATNSARPCGRTLLTTVCKQIYWKFLIWNLFSLMKQYDSKWLTRSIEFLKQCWSVTRPCCQMWCENSKNKNRQPPSLPMDAVSWWFEYIDPDWCFLLRTSVYIGFVKILNMFLMKSNSMCLLYTVWNIMVQWSCSWMKLLF